MPWRHGGFFEVTWRVRVWRSEVELTADADVLGRGCSGVVVRVNEKRRETMPRINRDGVGIYYEVHGDGPPLLLTHGYSSTSAMWHGQIDALAKIHRLVLWDMRGHGQSDYPDDPAAYSEALTVGDMAAILDAIGTERAIIGGLSLGGYMSLAFYRAHPQRVSAPPPAIAMPGDWRLRHAAC